MSILAPAKPASLTFKLIVTDRFGAKHFDRVYVTVVPNRAPVAKPGLNRVVNINSPVTLVGGAEDPDAGHVVDMDYEWSVASAPSEQCRQQRTFNHWVSEQQGHAYHPRRER